MHLSIFAQRCARDRVLRLNELAQCQERRFPVIRFKATRMRSAYWLVEHKVALTVDTVRHMSATAALCQHTIAALTSCLRVGSEASLQPHQSSTQTISTASTQTRWHLLQWCPHSGPWWPAVKSRVLLDQHRSMVCHISSFSSLLAVVGRLRGRLCSGWNR